jgi:hypothetical protein
MTAQIDVPISTERSVSGTRVAADFPETNASLNTVANMHFPAVPTTDFVRAHRVVP